GHMLMGDDIRAVKAYDNIHIPSWTYHQFYAADDSPLGFLCTVNPQRDKPSRPDDQEIEALLSNPQIADWIRY
ncbi:MAG: cupin domain-containing protein, partial [Spirochaetales bacterium]|nr:cupin domain-containing protein [Spirochaetales bacterium]